MWLFPGCLVLLCSGKAVYRILVLVPELNSAFPSCRVFHMGCGVMQAVEGDAESARVAARALAGQRAGFLAEARAAEEAAVAARQRIPELEAEKRAAAAARVRTSLCCAFGWCLLSATGLKTRVSHSVNYTFSSHLGLIKCLISITSTCK